MNTETLYQDWLDHRKKIDISGTVADSVMSRIHAETQLRPQTLAAIGWFSLKYVKAALIAAGLVGGLIRIGGIIGLILGSCVEVKGGIL